MGAYSGDGIIMGLDPDTNSFLIAEDYCNTVNTNIELFLKDKTHKFTFILEEYKSHFPQFCEWIGADVDLYSALSEFNIKHNASIGSDQEK